MESVEKTKYWKILFYILGFIPLIFIISSITFYIHGNIILGYWGMDGIDPSEFPASVIYQNIVLYSLMITLFSIPVFAIAVIFYFSKNKNKILRKPIIAISVFYLIAIVLTFSKVLAFAMD